mmetsp:Transcript_133996/g.299502  ORF Transcript_133996/g.299502 Transcript_133996/m.299502 type:complete len:510 (+) Transcript_133996:57-1586(+)
MSVRSSMRLRLLDGMAKQWNLGPTLRMQRLLCLGLAILFSFSACMWTCISSIPIGGTSILSNDTTSASVYNMEHTVVRRQLQSSGVGNSYWSKGPILKQQGKELMNVGFMQEPSDDTHWSLQDDLIDPRRNHDCLVVDQHMLVNILGRWARSVEVTNLLSGDTTAVRVPEGIVDPSGFPLGDLNHVNAVLVDSLSGGAKEIWLPCGFHGDVVNIEWSSTYVRIIDTGTWQMRLGPRLLRSGGACAAMAVHLTGPERPAHICTFGGTDGKHDTGTFLRTVACYDRESHIWNQPFGTLPLGADHANVVMTPPSVCNAGDPARVFFMNFRTRPYGGSRPEIYAFDMPSGNLGTGNISDSAGWYLYANSSRFYGNSRRQLEEDHGRDAAGIVMADGGRRILNLGGVWYDYPPGKELIPRFRRPQPFSMIRSFDVCTRQWTNVGDLGVQLFALQSCASESLGVTITCGGTGPVVWERKRRENGSFENRTNSNFHGCILNRIKSHKVHCERKLWQ